MKFDSNVVLQASHINRLSFKPKYKVIIECTVFLIFLFCYFFPMESSEWKFAVRSIELYDILAFFAFDSSHIAREKS